MFSLIDLLLTLVTGVIIGGLIALSTTNQQVTLQEYLEVKNDVTNF